MESQEIAKQYIQYNPKLKIITCIQHKYAIIPGYDSNDQSNVTRHFQEIHKPGLSKNTTSIRPCNPPGCALTQVRPHIIIDQSESQSR